MALLDQALDQRLRLARALSPNDMVAGANYSGEIQIVRIKVLRHGRMRPESRSFTIPQMQLMRRQKRVFSRETGYMPPLLFETREDLAYLILNRPHLR